MPKDFTSWNECLRPDELEHHGIKGMSWGQRRYQNEDGSLTAAGRERYGVGSTKHTSARKMQRDLNNLDKGYANVVADQKYYGKKTANYSRRAYKAGRKGNDAKKQKLLAKALKYGQKAALNNKQKKAIEALQWKIIGKAASEGYTTTGSATKRYGVNRRGRIIRAIGLANGGVAGGLVAGVGEYKNSTVVDGQKFRVSKRGDGRTRIVNYNNASKIAAEERELERRRRMANANRG